MKPEFRDPPSYCHQHLPGSTPLRYVMRDPARSIDVGGRELDQVKRLARWWGVPIETKALGHGGYRVRSAGP